MGVFFKRKVSPESLRRQFEKSLSEGPLQGQALLDRANDLANGVETEKEFDKQSFLIALALFGVLLAVAIILDAKNLVADPAPYIGLASTTLGVLLGFLGGEASGSS